MISGSRFSILKEEHYNDNTEPQTNLGTDTLEIPNTRQKQRRTRKKRPTLEHESVKAPLTKKSPVALRKDRSNPPPSQHHVSLTRKDETKPKEQTPKCGHGFRTDNWTHFCSETTWTPRTPTCKESATIDMDNVLTYSEHDFLKPLTMANDTTEWISICTDIQIREMTIWTNSRRKINLPVTIETKTNPRNAQALIDSGAEGLFISPALAKHY